MVSGFQPTTQEQSSNILKALYNAPAESRRCRQALMGKENAAPPECEINKAGSGKPMNPTTLVMRR